MDEIINAIIFANEKHTATEMGKEIMSNSKGIRILAKCSTKEELLTEIKDEDDAIIFINIYKGVKDITEYLKSFGLKKRKFVCFIHENGFVRADLDKLKIPYIEHHFTEINLAVEIKRHKKENIVLEEKEIVVTNGDSIKHKPIKIPVGVSLIFKIKDGEKHFELSKIKGFFTDKNTKSVVLVLAVGKKIPVKEKMKSLHELLKKYKFCRAHRSYLLNLLYVLSLSDDFNYAVLHDGKLPLGRAYKPEFIKEWRDFWTGDLAPS